MELKKFIILSITIGMMLNQCAIVTTNKNNSLPFVFEVHPKEWNISNSITIRYKDKTIKCYDSYQHSLRGSSLFLLQPYWRLPSLPLLLIRKIEGN